MINVIVVFTNIKKQIEAVAWDRKLKEIVIQKNKANEMFF